ncbi:dapper homolog 2 [Heptranchias perlo]|uniref:dapper homolog 2 n=1 Tax=Heptranchias perlo TaxID=212740 RepID=UPI003559AC0B
MPGSTPAPSAAFDRCRAGERLRAALAGLQELDLLKERQGELVRRALEMEHPRAKCGRDERNRESYTEEQRLEATLSALKEQLSHLRKQDAGLKTHLQHLDRQISELKLDVNKASTDQLESDSRPSSGFYELSDGGSCSLSNSCTSMYSECMSSSQSSLLYCSQQAETKASKSEYRPRSADETTVKSAGFKQQGPGKRPGPGIRTTAEPVLTVTAGKPGVARPRPVSTGDLERFQPSRRDPPTPPGLNVLLFVRAGGDLQPPIADQKYRCDLVSKNSGDVYNYPSPLHAVALQSPLFCLSGQDGRRSLTCTAPPNPAIRPMPLEARLGHVNKPAQRHVHEINEASTDRDPETSPKAAMPEKDLSRPAEAMRNNSNGDGVRGQFENAALPRQGSSWRLPAETAAIARLRRQEATGRSTVAPSANRLAGEPPASVGARPFTPVASGSGLPVRSDSKRLTYSDPTAPGAEAPRRSGQRYGGSARRGGQAWPGNGFVHAQFVPAEPRLRVQTAPAGSRTKVVKIKRRNGEKVRAGKRLPVRAGEGFRTTPDGNGGCRPQLGSGTTATADAGPESAGRSCSESSLYPMCGRRSPSCYRPSFQSSAPDAKAREGGTTAKQRRWLSSVEIFAQAPAAGELCRGAHRQRAGRVGVARGNAGFSRPSRDQARSESDQSEYSAECASLFHSTVAETSGDERSDHTANCFGDGESSDGGLSIPAGGSSSLVWPQGSETAGATSRSSHSEARICRIKASKALKKKIRRFQPETLKIMTMV